MYGGRVDAEDDEEEQQQQEEQHEQEEDDQLQGDGTFQCSPATRCVNMTGVGGAGSVTSAYVAALQPRRALM